MKRLAEVAIPSSYRMHDDGCELPPWSSIASEYLKNNKDGVEVYKFDGGSQAVGYPSRQHSKARQS